MHRPEWKLGLLLAVVPVLAACSAGPAVGTQASPRTIDLVMTDQMTFEPSRIEVRLGETIRFAVRNDSDQNHEAYIGTEEEQRLHETVHASVSAAGQASTTHMGYATHVPALGKGTIVATFDSDYEYVIGCHYPGHYAAGMRAVIEVLP